MTQAPDLAVVWATPLESVEDLWTGRGFRRNSSVISNSKIIHRIAVPVVRRASPPLLEPVVWSAAAICATTT